MSVLKTVPCEEVGFTVIVWILTKPVPVWSRLWVENGRKNKQQCCRTLYMLGHVGSLFASIGYIMLYYAILLIVAGFHPRHSHWREVSLGSTATHRWNHQELHQRVSNGKTLEILEKSKRIWSDIIWQSDIWLISELWGRRMPQMNQWNSVK